MFRLPVMVVPFHERQCIQGLLGYEGVGSQGSVGC